ncbi:hypothetical protein ACVGXP_01875, partial [Enterobacter hormaechei]
PVYTLIPLGFFFCRVALLLPGIQFPSTASFVMPDGDALTRHTVSFHSVVSFAGWRCGYRDTFSLKYVVC